jgi:DNA-binding NarL/FixJ family response regulator
VCQYFGLVADDHEIVRRGRCALLKSHTEWEVCAEAADGWEAIDKTHEFKPDIVILDIGMPNWNGLTAARQILQTQPNQKILILTITDEEQVIREILEAGARGFVLKSDAARDLVAPVEVSPSRNNVLHFPGRRNGSASIPKPEAGSFGRYAKFIEPYLARAADRAARGRGEEHERGRCDVGFECQDRREVPSKHHAQTRLPLQECKSQILHSQLQTSLLGLRFLVQNRDQQSE